METLVKRNLNLGFKQFDIDIVISYLKKVHKKSEMPFKVQYQRIFECQNTK